MFINHNAMIGAWARKSPENLERIFQFVCATIRQPLEMVPSTLQDYMLKGSRSVHAWGWKGDALDFYRVNAQEIYENCMNIYFAYACPKWCERELIAYLAELPGLGLVKGAFVAQLAFGVGGCMDSHNMKRFDVAPARFSASAYKGLKTKKSRAARVNEYCELVDKCGGGPALWDSWCEHVAGLRPEVFDNAHAVSELHVDALSMGAV